MTKQETSELELLSEQVLGHKYAWRKLTTKGVVMRGSGPDEIPRRHPLTATQAKDYMIKRQTMIQNLRKDIEANAEKVRNGETEGNHV